MTNEKTPIKPEDIREGDLIREERNKGIGVTYLAVEYRAVTKGAASEEGINFYLLERPEPPFDPYWGMVIHNPDIKHHRAVYSPATNIDYNPWIAVADSDDPESAGWRENNWAKQKLAEGWKILEKPNWAP